MRCALVFASIATIALSSCAAEEAAPAAPQSSRPLAGKLFGDAQAGRAAMERWCTTCHKANPPFSDQPAPPLATLAANADRSERAIRTFLMQPHPPMPPLELSNQMIEDIIAYLDSLGSNR